MIRIILIIFLLCALGACEMSGGCVDEWVVVALVIQLTAACVNKGMIKTLVCQRAIHPVVAQNITVFYPGQIYFYVFQKQPHITVAIVFLFELF